MLLASLGSNMLQPDLQDIKGQGNNIKDLYLPELMPELRWPQAGTNLSRDETGFWPYLRKANFLISHQRIALRCIIVHSKSTASSHVLQFGPPLLLGHVLPLASSIPSCK
jgi:hypothetical protein